MFFWGARELADEVIRLRHELREYKKKYDKPKPQPKGKVTTAEIDAALSYQSRKNK